MNLRWKKSKKAVYNIGYHLIWCVKFRRKALKGAIETRLKEIILERALVAGAEIITLEVMPDHVHVFVKADPTDSPHYLVQQFKGYASHALRVEFPELQKLPCLWSRSYYRETVGHISERTVKRYIRDQKGK